MACIWLPSFKSLKCLCPGCIPRKHLEGFDVLIIISVKERIIPIKTPFIVPRKRVDNKVQEFVWAYGAESEEQIEKQIVLQIQQLKKTGDMEKLFHGSWSHMDAFDEDEWLEHLEEHLKEIVNISGKDEKTIAERFEKHREEIHRRIRDEHPEMAERFKERRQVLDEHLKEKHPEVICPLSSRQVKYLKISTDYTYILIEM